MTSIVELFPESFLWLAGAFAALLFLQFSLDSTFLSRNTFTKLISAIIVFLLAIFIVWPAWATLWLGEGMWQPLLGSIAVVVGLGVVILWILDSDWLGMSMKFINLVFVIALVTLILRFGLWDRILGG